MSAVELMRTLCRDIGPRPPGSAGMRHAQALLQREWSAFGATNIHTEAVSFEGWKPGKAKVELLGSSRRRLAATQAVHSAPGTVEGPLQDGGKLEVGDLLRLGDAAKGAILLAKGHVITGSGFEPTQKRVSLAESLGAAGVILVGWDRTLPVIQFLNRARVPVVNVSPADWNGLSRLRHARVRIRATGRTRPVTCANLIAELTPRRPTRETIVACAHLDTFHPSPGAVDNTSGVVTMTEVARALAPYREQFVRTLRFIAFTGEEYGYAGSKHYVRVHEAELDRVRLVYSMDCLFPSTARGVAVMWSPSMCHYIARTLPGVEVRNRFCMSSDYLPFMLAGVPAARPADWHNGFPAFTHTTKDTDEKVPASWLKPNIRTSARLLLRLLTDPRPLPSKRNSREEVHRLIAKDAAGELLRWQVLLPA
jgi:hypothetical protein